MSAITLDKDPTRLDSSQLLDNSSETQDDIAIRLLSEQGIYLVLIDSLRVELDVAEAAWLGSLATKEATGVSIPERASNSRPSIDQLIELKRSWNSLCIKLHTVTEGKVVSGEFIGDEGVIRYGLVGGFVQIDPAETTSTVARPVPVNVNTSSSVTRTRSPQAPNIHTKQLLKRPQEIRTESVTSHEWGYEAACVIADPDTFFPLKGGSTREAKRICKQCPVILECREYALANAEAFGIWGGMSERERNKELRLRRVSAKAA